MTNAKRQAKDRDGWECQFCGMDNDEHKNAYARGLHAHHIVKRNDNGPDEPRNYITVCRSCHRTLENTQADAISALRDSILSAIDSEYVTAEELFDIMPRPEENNTEEDEPRKSKVKLDYSYVHERHGPVYVKGFETEVVGADETGKVHDVVVEYTQLNADNKIRLRAPLSEFAEETHGETEYSAEARRMADDD